NAHMPKENREDPNSKTLETVFEDLTAYKNRNGGIWGRGEMHLFKNVKVGETENIGNPRTDGEKAYGRSLPKPQMPDFPIRGYEYYDYRQDVVNTTFR